MLAFLNLGAGELVLTLVVAVLVFGRDLPGAAVRAAATLTKLRRSLADLRRETGIDEELRRAQREIEQSLPRGSLDLPRIVEQKLEQTLEAPPRGAPPRAGESTGKDGGSR